jgi:heat shock protein HtpX
MRRRRRRRRELFPADRGLQVRMVTTAVLTPALVLAALALCVAVLPWKGLIGLGVVVFIGFGAAFGDGDGDATYELLEPSEEPELQGIVDRLCVVADLPRPEIALADERQPNSWIVDAPGRPSRLFVTCGLLELLEPTELEAVVAHELSHVANRDATVMTVVGAPGAVLLHGGRTNLGWWGPLVAARLLSFAVGFLATIGSNALSRYRELTADAGAVALTGRPSALASALLKVSGALERVPSTDLRAVAVRDGLHLLAVDDASGWRRLLGRTHPSVERRIAALERLEHRVAHARTASPS